MLKFLINLSVYAVWLALAAAFGLGRYSNVGCLVTERYDWRRSRQWSRIVAIIMMTCVEIIYWQPFNRFMALWEAEETEFFTFAVLAFFAYGLHRVFCLLVEHFDDIGYTRAEDNAKAYSEHCSNCCFRARNRVTDLECPVMGVDCPCLEDGHDIRDVNYTSEVFTALRKARDAYSRRGLKMPSRISLTVPTHRVVVNENPFDYLFDKKWEFDVELDGISLIVNQESPKTAKIIDFPAAAAYTPEPAEPAIESVKPTTKRDLLQVRLVRGSHGAFKLRMTESGIECRLTRELPGGRIFDQEVIFPGSGNYQILDEFLFSDQGELLCRFINAPALTEEQIARLG